MKPAIGGTLRLSRVTVTTALLPLLISSLAQASVLQYAMPDYYLGVLVRGILTGASHVGYQQYDVLQAPAAQQKARQALLRIYQVPAFNYTYDNISIVVIRGLPDEPNGFAFGNNIFITKSMIDLLSPRELTAVIAHELAHTEKAHNLQKTPLPLGAIVYQLGNIARSVKARQWPKRKDLAESIKKLISTGGLAMELQADCIAAQQLDYMKSKGLNHQATDLISANNKLMGYDVTTDDSDDPTAIRTRALMHKVYRNGPCDIF